LPGEAVFRTETEFVTWLRSRASGGLRIGIGDDAAVIAGPRGRDLVLKTDLSIEGVHFTRGLHPPRSVGHRALARSLSDLAAMGATPKFALISLAVSKRATQAWIKQVYSGIFALAARFGVAVVGGDTAVVPGATLLDAVAVGDVGRGAAVRRSGARPGDQVYVSGRLGLSALGLRLLRSTGGRRRLTAKRIQDRAAARAVRAHLYPEPRCALGQYLSQKRLASALIDLSDGLSTDLGHVCLASGVGAIVWADRIPAPPLGGARRSGDPDSLSLALHGGEDYELLFTVPRGKVSRLPARFRGVRLHLIGEIRRSRDVLLIQSNGSQAPLRPRGYDHFRR